MIAEGGEEEEECHDHHQGGDQYDEYSDEGDYYQPSDEFMDYFIKLNEALNTMSDDEIYDLLDMVFPYYANEDDEMDVHSARAFMIDIGSWFGADFELISDEEAMDLFNSIDYTWNGMLDFWEVLDMLYVVKYWE